MSKYNIHRWDSFIVGKNTTPKPMIYIKPDKQLIAFAELNYNAIMIEISGTNSIYDGKKIPGVFGKSSNLPNCMPNFFETTGLYTIQLVANWYGYPQPDALGSIIVYGANKEDVGVDEVIEEVIEEENYLKSPKLNLLQHLEPLENAGMCNIEILGVICVIFILFGIILYSCKGKKVKSKK